MAQQTAQCGYCGRDCGNPGARANHEAACDENPDNQEARPRHPSQAADGHAPARRDSPAQNAVQRQDAPGQNHGGVLVDAAIALTDDDLPSQTRAKALRSGLGIIGDGIVRYQQYRERKMEEQRSRAKSVELGEPEDYPQCKCGYTFGPDDIGLTDREVRCPDCSTIYPIRDAEDIEV